MNVKGRSRYEVVIVTLVVALAVAVSIGIFARRTRVEHSRTMIGELSAMRTGILLYKLLNRANPSSLDALMSERYAAAGGEMPYLDNVYRDAGGKIVDPFGNRYIYDAQAGWVRSTTKGHERW